VEAEANPRGFWGRSVLRVWFGTVSTPGGLT
jgi:hypothetical protein